MKQKTKDTAKKVGMGAGILAATAAGAAAGYYFYASKDAKKHRQDAAKWASGLKRDVLKEAKKLQNLDRRKMLRIVDDIAETYESVRGLDQKDLARAVRELKDNWRHLQAELQVSPKGKAVKKKTARKSA